MSNTVAASAPSSSPKSSSPIFRSATALAFVASLCVIPSVGMAGSDPGLALYQCAVLGDRSVCPVTPPEPAQYEELRIEPGPYARYLMYIGWSEGEAITMARDIGEFPRRVVIRVVHNELTSQQEYDRWQGRPAPQDRTETILSWSIEDSPKSEDGRRIAGARGSAR